MLSLFKENKGQGNVLVGIFSGLIALVMLVVIGLSIAGTAWQQNYSTVNNLTDTNSKTAIQTAVINTFTSIQTAAGYVPILVLAVIGGVALFYVLNFSTGGKKGAM